MFQHQCGDNLQNYAAPGPMKEVIFTLVHYWAKPQGKEVELALCAYRENTGNPLLAAFCRQAGLSPQAPDALERVLRAGSGFVDAQVWNQGLFTRLHQVCRVEVPRSDGKTGYGTGFLVGPDLLLTNYHVVDLVIDSETTKASGVILAAPQEVRLRFDYKMLNGSELNGGAVRRLAADWLVDYSPMSSHDNELPPKTGDPAPDELDYALLRLAGRPGEEAVGSYEGAPQRGWISLAAQPPALQPDAPLVILQHPDAEPLKLAFADPGVIGLNGNHTRLTYRVNTGKGSSGSPVFSFNWNLVALHHSGDPNYALVHQPEYNEGIPIQAIAKLLETRGKLGLLQG